MPVLAISRNLPKYPEQTAKTRTLYLVAIAWIFVTLCMALTEPSVIAGLLTFFFYGLAPLALLLWIVGTPQRRRNKARLMAVPREGSDQPDRGDAQRNE
jgi:hypothetical protein